MAVYFVYWWNCSSSLFKTNVKRPKSKSEATNRNRRRTDNTTAKRKKTKGQTTQRQREKRQKDRQHNGKEKKDKRTNNDLPNTTQKAKDRTKRTPTKTGGERRCSGRVSSSCFTCDTHRLNFLFLVTLTVHWMILFNDFVFCMWLHVFCLLFRSYLRLRYLIKFQRFYSNTQASLLGC